MNTVHLDCSGLHNIRLEKGNLPDTIYIDGSQFLTKLEQILDRHQASDVQEYERRLRDEFAAKAMQGMIANGILFSQFVKQPEVANERICLAAYDMADKMMEARE